MKNKNSWVESFFTMANLKNVSSFVVEGISLHSKLNFIFEGFPLVRENERHFEALIFILIAELLGSLFSVVFFYLF